MSQPEARVSKAIMKAWRERGVFCFKVWGSAHQMSGLPDIIGVYRGFFIGCETKMPGNEPSRIQLHRIAQITAAGGKCVVAYSVEDAMKLLDSIDAGKYWE